MSWKAINVILGRAATDEDFCQELLKDPVKAIRQQHFTLTKDEEEKLGRIVAQDLADFSQQVLTSFGKE